MNCDSSGMDRVMYFKVLSRYLAAGHEEDTNDPNEDSIDASLESNLKIPEYEEGLSISQ
jgi:hypothetical protein